MKNQILIAANGTVVAEETMNEWANDLKQYGMFYLHASTGYGKTSVTLEFAKNKYKHWSYFSLKDDFRTSDILNAIEANEHSKMAHLVILDDLQWIFKEESENELVATLNQLFREKKKYHIILLSRASVPAYMKHFMILRQMVIKDFKQLELGSQEIEAIFKHEKMPLSKQQMDLILLKTSGYPVAVMLYLNYFKMGIVDFSEVSKRIRVDIIDYFEQTAIGNWPLKVQKLVICMAGFREFTLELAYEIMKFPDIKEVLELAMKIGGFLSFIPPNRYFMHPFFASCIREKQIAVLGERRKQIYIDAGNYFNQKMNLPMTLLCYYESEQYEKLAERLCYIIENSDGCPFVKENESYFESIPKEVQEKMPRFLAAKALLYSYKMMTVQSDEYLKMLKEYVDKVKNKEEYTEALAAYLRVYLMLPHGNPRLISTKLRKVIKWQKDNQIKILNVLPTGNMPGYICGALDMSLWSKYDEKIYYGLKYKAEPVLGMAGVGLADVAYGDFLYEKNKRTEAVSYLSRGLAAANLEGTLRMQYAAVGILVKAFLAEGHWDTAWEMIKNIEEKAEKKGYLELLPNIKSTKARCALKTGDLSLADDWDRVSAKDFDQFYITDRYELLTRVRLFIATGKEIEALSLLQILQDYSKKYYRKYIQIEALLLKSIILFRRKEGWQEDFLKCLKKASYYYFIRVIADEGAAILPMWKQLKTQEPGLNTAYYRELGKAIKMQAELYPNYLFLQNT